MAEKKKDKKPETMGIKVFEGTAEDLLVGLVKALTGGGEDSPFRDIEAYDNGNGHATDAVTPAQWLGWLNERAADAANETWENAKPKDMPSRMDYATDLIHRIDDEFRGK